MVLQILQLGPTGATRIVLHFSAEDFESLFEYAPSGLVATYTLKMFDCSSAYRKPSLPGDTTVNVYAFTGGTLF